MTTLDIDIIKLATSRRDEVKSISLIMRGDGTCMVTVETRPPAPTSIDQWREEPDVAPRADSDIDVVTDPAPTRGSDE
jgi:hypothetical protein